ncbi:MAG TPA: IS30 family transposase [Nocardiopsis listeri]|uniref:IS30 family transposase n=1 Tax=Nocardiopsis listeri TaxID=53440 RepID=UPI001D35D19B|nr:IS30 family transposase [Nocardiopsis listeri]HJE59309.1 IS30 family transposase [Nocardiopsis listeri]
MKQGYSNTAACQIVGVDARTGRKWRNGRGPENRQRAVPPITTVVPPTGPSRYLTQHERLQIADLHREGKSVRAIAAELDRDPSTVSRELRRNATVDPRGKRHYRPHVAQARSDARRPRPKPSKIALNPELCARIQELLTDKWSPEQISRRLERDFPDRPELHVCHETIYQALYVQGRGELRRELASALRSGRARRRPHRQAQQRRPRFASPMVMISERPPEVADRAVPGHWEGDLIIGADGASAIGTLVERSTRYVMLLHLPHGRSSEQVRDALTDTVQTLPRHLARSITWDQGAEMAAHGSFTTATDIPVYFCDPASPWQRGSNENTNGLLRQYFPKSTDLSVHTREHLEAVAVQLNGRPRKTLGWDTPAERLAKLLESSN